jgi:hypothetical protein
MSSFYPPASASGDIFPKITVAAFDMFAVSAATRDTLLAKGYVFPEIFASLAERWPILDRDEFDDVSCFDPFLPAQ